MDGDAHMPSWSARTSTSTLATQLPSLYQRQWAELSQHLDAQLHMKAI